MEMNMLFYSVTYIKKEASSHGRKASSWSDPHQAPPSIKKVTAQKTKTARRVYAAIHRYNLNTFLRRLYLTKFVSLSLGFYVMMRSPAKTRYTV
jgi:hypothetical protein